MNRRQERETVFCLLFEKCFSEDNPSDILNTAKDSREFDSSEYIEDVFFGVCSKNSEIDKIIIENLNNWTIERISKVALTILRLSIYEILYVKTIPVSVSVNEAVELAKKYSLETDASFINGVLSSVIKKLR